MTELSKIAQKYYTDKGCTYYNSHCFTEIYDSYFQKFKNENRKIYILEIGIQYGYDLLMINEYFEGNCEIWGIDINTSIIKADLPENVHIIEMNATDSQKLNELYHSNIVMSVNKIPNFDIIIDDGSHHSCDIFATLKFFYNKLSYDGIYIIEDLHYSGATEAKNYINNFNHIDDELDKVTNNIKTSIIYNINSYCCDFGNRSSCAILQFKN
jgi:hypothetical protein